MKNPTLLFAIILPAVQMFAQSKNPSDYKLDATTGFLENKGQIVDQNYKSNAGVKYLLCQRGLNVQLRQTGFSYDTYTDTIDKKDEQGRDKMPKDKFQTPVKSTRYYHRVDIELVGCNPNAEMIAEVKSSAYYNYFTAGTPQGGVSDIHFYQKVTYKNIYPNIDLVFYAGHQNGAGDEYEYTTLWKGRGGMEYNFVVHPGGNPADIKLAYNGANKITLADNKLIVNVAAGDFTENIPSSYLADSKKEVQVNYASLGNNTYGFSIANFQILNSASDLIIDPTPCLDWATYYGGTGTDDAFGISLDATGNVYITGFASSTTNIATAGAYQTVNDGGDAFVAKFNPSGTSLSWATYYGGTAGATGYGIALDASDNVYITGVTQSTTNIATVGAYQTVFGGSEDAFIAKFNSTGTSLLWGTYYGGTGAEDGVSIALDASDNIYITGETQSTTNIATVGAYQTVYGTNSDAFIAKFNPSGTSLLWGTYYGGAGNEFGYAIALDASDNVYITGSTSSPTHIATAGAYQTVYGGSDDAFVAKFNPSGSSLLWGTYYGGTGIDFSYGIALDASDNVYITGYTTSGGFNVTTVGAYLTAYGGLQDAFVAKFNSSGSSLLWGTYYGNTSYTTGYGIALDASDNVYVTGSTNSTINIATAGSYQTTDGALTDAFVAKFNPSGTSLLWGTYYGGVTFSYATSGSAIALDASDNVYITGSTGNIANIATAGAYQTVLGGGEDGFVAEFGCNLVPLAITASQTDVTCNGSCNGSATAIPSSGTLPYTYNWTPSGGSNAIASNLCIGSYTCTVTDALATTGTVGVTITQPVTLTANMGAPTNELCNGGNTGSATVTAGGGTAVYTYSWTPNGGSNAMGIGLTAGSYTVTVKDNNACMATASVAITQPLVLTANMGVPTNELCNGDNTGSATVTAGGGTTVYTYSWTPNGGSNAMGAGLTAGSYTVTVKDNNACIATASVTITAPSPVTAVPFVISNSRICVNTGSASVTPGGGKAPYSYLWTGGNTNVNATGLSAGNYTVTVKDNNACTATASLTITQPASTLTGSAVLARGASCNPTGIAIASGANGSSPYQYLWSPGGSTINEPQNLSTGTYTVTVTDHLGCTVTASVIITQAPLLVATVMENRGVTCPGTGLATASGTNGTTPYAYLWNPGGNTGNQAQNLNVGTYTVMIKDHLGCVATASIAITQAGLLSVNTRISTCDGSGDATITSVPTHGTTPYHYLWSDAATTVSISVPANIYTITVTDALGCTASASATVTCPPVISNEEPKAPEQTMSCCDEVNNINVYPNPFSQKVNIKMNIAGGPVYVTVFNMFGKNLGTWTMDSGVNTINTQTFSPGVYIMQIKTKEGILNKKLIKMN